MKKLKIAFCLSGEMREWETAAKHLTQWFSDHDCDFFINTWDEIGGKGKKYSIEKIPHAEIEKIYKPKVFNIQKKSDWNCLDLLDKRFPYREHEEHADGLWNAWVSQYQGWYKLSLLVQEYVRANNTRYDLVVRTRPDCVPFWSMDPNTFLQQANQHVNRGYDFRWGKTAFLCSEGQTELGSDGKWFLKQFWKERVYPTDKINSFVDSLHSKAKSLLSTKTSKIFTQDQLKNFILDDVSHLIDDKTILNKLLKLRKISDNSSGVNDVLNITSYETYVLYTELLFTTLFVGPVSDLMHLKLNLQSVIIQMMQHQPYVIPEMSLQLGNPILPDVTKSVECRSHDI